MDYITPLMFGAVGNGKVDDTVALRKSISASHSSGIPILIPSGYTFYVTEPMNENREVRLYIVGNCIHGLKIKTGDEVKTGCIRLGNSTHLFQDATEISGFIKGVYFYCEVCKDFNWGGNGAPKHKENTVHFFDNCTLHSLTIRDCYFCRMEAFLYDSSLYSICNITYSMFLTCYWFAKFGSKEMIMCDSTIANNYINGGQELCDNECFEFGYYNAATITHNFIDYYRTIYHPKAPHPCGFAGPLSQGNQYQMFKYFYYFEEPQFSDMTFMSDCDVFNHTFREDNATGVDAEKLEGYQSLKVYNQDKTVSTAMPSCIAYTKETGIISITNMKIESWVKTILFIKDSIVNYEYSKFTLTIACGDVFARDNVVQLETDWKVYNGGHYRFTNKIETNLVKMYSLEELPEITEGWVSEGATFGMNACCLVDNGSGGKEKLLLKASIAYFPDGWHCCWLTEQGMPFRIY